MGAHRARKFWSDEDVAQLRELVAAGTPYGDMAKVFGCTYDAVEAKARSLGIAYPRQERWSPEEVEQIRVWLEAGWSVTDIAHALGVSRGSVYHCTRTHLGHVAWHKPRVRQDSSLLLLTARVSADDDDTALDDDLGPTTTLSAVARTGCRHVYGSPLASDPAMCGRAVRDGSRFGWCEHHERRFMRQVPADEAAA